MMCYVLSSKQCVDLVSVFLSVCFDVLQFGNGFPLNFQVGHPLQSSSDDDDDFKPVSFLPNENSLQQVRTCTCKSYLSLSKDVVLSAINKINSKQYLQYYNAVVQMAKANGVRWYGNVLRRDDGGHVLRKVLDFEVKGKSKQGQPRPGRCNWRRRARVLFGEGGCYEAS